MTVWASNPLHLGRHVPDPVLWAFEKCFFGKRTVHKAYFWARNSHRSYENSALKSYAYTFWGLLKIAVLF